MFFSGRQTKTARNFLHFLWDSISSASPSDWHYRMWHASSTTPRVCVCVRVKGFRSCFSSLQLPAMPLPSWWCSSNSSLGLMSSLRSALLRSAPVTFHRSRDEQTCPAVGRNTGSPGTKRPLASWVVSPPEAQRGESGGRRAALCLVHRIVSDSLYASLTTFVRRRLTGVHLSFSDECDGKLLPPLLLSPPPHLRLLRWSGNFSKTV